jgi:hypothetical protein
LIKSNSGKYGLTEYVYLSYDSKSDDLKIAKIFSEMDLLTEDRLLKRRIADNLLSSERVKKKVNEFNGYVGYITKDSATRYYNSNIEENIIGKHR